MRRISAEAAELLHQALEIIFERAPTGIIDAAGHALTRWAGKYGEENQR